jgi:hypothetical protein
MSKILTVNTAKALRQCAVLAVISYSDIVVSEYVNPQVLQDLYDSGKEMILAGAVVEDAPDIVAMDKLIAADVGQFRAPLGEAPHGDNTVLLVNNLQVAKVDIIGTILGAINHVVGPDEDDGDDGGGDGVDDGIDGKRKKSGYESAPVPKKSRSLDLPEGTIRAERDSVPIDEFTNPARLRYLSFPDLFLLGEGSPTATDPRPVHFYHHQLHQHDNRFAVISRRISTPSTTRSTVTLSSSPVLLKSGGLIPRLWPCWSWSTRRVSSKKGDPGPQLSYDSEDHMNRLVYRFSDVGREKLTGYFRNYTGALSRSYGPRW